MTGTKSPNRSASVRKLCNWTLRLDRPVLRWSRVGCACIAVSTTLLASPIANAQTTTSHALPSPSAVYRTTGPGTTTNTADTHTVNKSPLQRMGAWQRNVNQTVKGVFLGRPKATAPSQAATSGVATPSSPANQFQNVPGAAGTLRSATDQRMLQLRHQVATADGNLPITTVNRNEIMPTGQFSPTGTTVGNAGQLPKAVSIPFNQSQRPNVRTAAQSSRDMEMLRILQAQSSGGIQNSQPLPPPPSTSQNLPPLPNASVTAPTNPGQGSFGQGNMGQGRFGQSNQPYLNQTPPPGTAKSQLTPPQRINQPAPIPSPYPNHAPSYATNQPYHPSQNSGVYGQPSRTVYPPAIHGSQLHESARTATERALKLQEENGDLKATIATLQHELKSRDEKNVALERLSEKSNRALTDAQREIDALLTSNTQLRKKVTEWETKYTRQQLQFDREIKFISEELDDLLTREIISPSN